MSKSQLQRIIRGELIGTDTKIINSNNKSNLGIQGKITNETKHTITIGEKMVFKKNITLEINKIEVLGKLLDSRPQDRIKVRI